MMLHLACQVLEDAGLEGMSVALEVVRGTLCEVQILVLVHQNQVQTIWKSSFRTSSVDGVVVVGTLHKQRCEFEGTANINEVHWKGAAGTFAASLLETFEFGDESPVQLGELTTFALAAPEQ